MRRLVCVLFCLVLCACAAPAKAPRPVAATPAAPASAAAPVPSAAAPIVAAPPAAANVETDLMAGFNGLAWGSDRRDVPGLILESEQPLLRTAAFRRQDEPAVFKGLPATRILYEFYENAFYHVWIEFVGRQEYDAFLNALTGQYGPPNETKPEKYYNAWALGQVNVYCAFHPDDGTGDVSFWFQPIYERKATLVRQVKQQVREATPQDDETQENGHDQSQTGL